MDFSIGTKHRQSLASLCRICGSRFSRRRDRSYDTTKYCNQLHLAFGVIATSDMPDVHPVLLCCDCYRTMTRRAERANEKMPNEPSATLVSWLPHTEESCNACQRAEDGQKGRRKRKNKHPDKPTSVSVAGIASRLRMVALIGYRPSEVEFPLLHPKFTALSDEISIDDFLCASCNDIVERPLEANCNHLVCCECAITAFTPSASNGQYVCKWDGCELQSPHDKLQKPSNIILRTLGSLKIKCPKNCQKFVGLSDLAAHYMSCEAATTAAQKMAPRRSLRLRDILEMKAAKTPTTLESW
eukprot:m.282662 g.282662  ORF g.282662 m.282662 type:complete len:299 (+) comp40660_c0_seq6:538-1434(+)